MKINKNIKGIYFVLLGAVSVAINIFSVDGLNQGLVKSSSSSVDKNPLTDNKIDLCNKAYDNRVPFDNNVAGQGLNKLQEEIKKIFSEFDMVGDVGLFGDSKIYELHDYYKKIEEAQPEMFAHIRENKTLTDKEKKNLSRLIALYYDCKIEQIEKQYKEKLNKLENGVKENFWYKILTEKDKEEADKMLFAAREMLEKGKCHDIQLLKVQKEFFDKTYNEIHFNQFMGRFMNSGIFLIFILTGGVVYFHYYMDSVLHEIEEQLKYLYDILLNTVDENDKKIILQYYSEAFDLFMSIKKDYRSFTNRHFICTGWIRVWPLRYAMQQKAKKFKEIVEKIQLEVNKKSIKI